MRCYHPDCTRPRWLGRGPCPDHPDYKRPELTSLLPDFKYSVSILPDLTVLTPKSLSILSRTDFIYRQLPTRACLYFKDGKLATAFLRTLE